MKKQLTFTVLGTMFVAGSALAASQKIHDVSVQPEKTLPKELRMKGQIYQMTYPQNSSFNTSAKVSPNDEIIKEVNGTQKYYEKFTQGVFANSTGYAEGYEGTYSAEIVWGYDNDVYFKNILSECPTDCYVKGTVSGNKITLPMHQPIIYWESFGWGYNIGVFETAYAESFGTKWFEPNLVRSIESVDFIIESDGTITLELDGQEFDENGEPLYWLGYYFDDDGLFSGYAEYTQVYTPMAIDAVEIPENAEVVKYAFIDVEDAHLVDVAIVDNVLYIRGLSTELPNATFMANIEGTIATVPQNQLVGLFQQYFIQMKVAYVDPNDSQNLIPAPEDEGYELYIDLENKQIKSQNRDQVLLFNADENKDYNISAYMNILLDGDLSYEGTPMNPLYVWVDPEYENAGYPRVDLMGTLPLLSTERKILNPDELFFRVYIDDEPYVFEEEINYEFSSEVGFEWLQYEGLTEPTELIPFTFNNKVDIYFYRGQRDVGIYIEGFNMLGYQLVYDHNGVTKVSDIVYYDVENDKNVIVPGEDSGVAEVAAGVVSTEYFDLNGRRVATPAEGVYVKRMVLSDGTAVTRKVMKR